jgi:hypothetical protein
MLLVSSSPPYTSAESYPPVFDMLLTQLWNSNLLQCRHLLVVKIPRHLSTIGHLHRTQLVVNACNHAGSIRVELVATPRVDEVAVTLVALRDQN